MSSQSMPGRLSPDLLQALHGNKPVRRFPQGATLIQHASPAMGVYLVESGEVRVLLPTGPNQNQMVEVVGPGSLLGLSENMIGEDYRVSLEAVEETTAVFIPRAEFLSFLREHCDFCIQVVQVLSKDLHRLYEKFRNITAHPGRPRQRLLDEQVN